MKKTLAAILAIGALTTVAAPALAQPYGGGQPDRPGYDQRGPGDYRGGNDHDRGDYRGDRGDRDNFGGVRQRVDAVLAKADRALRSDRLRRSERASISYRAQKLGNMMRQYERGGLTGYERATLTRDANDLDHRIDRAVRGRW